MRQEISFGKLKLTNNKGASNNVTQVMTALRIGVSNLVGPSFVLQNQGNGSITEDAQQLNRM